MTASAEFTVFIAAAMTFALILIAVVMIVLKRQLQERRYDEDRHQAQLETIRKSFEEQIYRMTDRLVATEDRWRDVNHLLVSGQRFAAPLERPPQLPTSEFLERAGLPNSGAEVDKKLVFVLTPFHPDYEVTYRTVSAVCGDIGLTCMRGDEEHVKGDLLQHILRILVKARLVIANLDGRNPNVFYELGIAHALGKSVLAIASSPADLPFDVRTTRIIFWSSQDELQKKLRDELLKVFVAGG